MVLILDSDTLEGLGLEFTIHKYQPEEEVTQVRTVAQANERVASVGIEAISLIVVDIHLDDEDVLDFVEDIRKAKYKGKVLAVTSLRSSAQFKRAMNLNIDAYILKDDFLEEMKLAWQKIENGQKYYSSDLVGEISGMEEEEVILSRFTRRELEVLYRIGAGDENEAVAKNCHISDGTVKKHMSNISNKVDCGRRQLVIFAYRNQQRIADKLKIGPKKRVRIQ
ncbi:MAG: DNA-binding response regulator [Lachnoanaerobaculum sp.]|jgi:nitrate/nitrite response regulator protein|nr:MAG: DNA-binding response regulator [Lachnoanaerobaculum sp.]